ncbi:MAG: hypothetical protein K0R17_3288 [Rariglobus sp.]|jgi:hypothetical protein|nr:hypothetical protein [Rariglobus sp.]
MPDPERWAKIMKNVALLICCLSSICLRAEDPAAFKDPNTSHAESARILAGKLTREQIDEEIMFQLYRTLHDAKYPIKHDEIVARAKRLTEVTGWHMSATRKVRKLFYDLPLFSSSTERYKLMLIVASGERSDEMIISEAKIAVVLKSGYYIKEDISE